MLSIDPWTSVLLSACLLVPFPAQASLASQGDRPAITLNALLHAKTPRVSNLNWTSDGKELTGRYARPGHTPVLRAWSLNGEARDLTQDVSPGLSPDGKLILVPEAGAWVLRSSDVTARRLATLPAGRDATASQLALPVWSRDSRFVAIVEDVRDASASAPVPDNDSGSVLVVDVGARLDASRPHGSGSIITVIDAEHPQRARHIRTRARVYALEWGPDVALYATLIDFATPTDSPATTVERVDFRNGRFEETFSVGGIQQTVRPRVSPDGRWLAIACDVDDQRWDDFVSLVVVDTNTRAVHRLTRTQAVSSFQWTEDGRGLFLSARDGGVHQLFRVDLKAQVTQLTSSATRKGNLVLSPKGHLLAYVARDGRGTTTLRVVRTNGEGDRAVSIVDDPAARYRLGEFKHVYFPNVNGVRIGAYLFFPPDFDPRRKYPLYVDVHGGGPGSPLGLDAPWTAMIGAGPLEWHVWASLGYIVFVPDYRSSGAYGQGVASDRYRTGDYQGMAGDALDVESGTRYMLEQPYVDPARIAVLGTSAGGARVNLLLTRSPLYRAGVMFEAISAGPLPDLIAATTGEAAGYSGWETQLRGLLSGYSLRDRPDLYLGGFLFDGYKSRTPTLIVVGDSAKGAADPLSSEALFSVLRVYGVPTRMLRYPEEGHGLADPRAVRHAFVQVLAWLDEHLDIARDSQAKVIYEGTRVKSRGAVPAWTAQDYFAHPELFGSASN